MPRSSKQTVDVRKRKTKFDGNEEGVVIPPNEARFLDEIAKLLAEMIISQGLKDVDEE